MKTVKILLLAAIALFPLTGMADNPNHEVNACALDIKLNQEQMAVTLHLDVEIKKAGTTLELLNGPLGLIEKPKLHKSIALSSNNGALSATFDKKGHYKFDLDFAGRSPNQNGRYSCVFRTVDAPVRHANLHYDDPDLDLSFGGALPASGPEAEGRFFLKPGEAINLQWKAGVQKLSAEAVLNCEAHALASAGVGALRLDVAYLYSIVQGECRRFELKVPERLEITGVEGADILSWNVTGEGDKRQIEVTLNRSVRKNYMLQILGEMPLREFPNQFKLPLPEPQGVLRTAGSLQLGTDHAIKLLVEKADGMTQSDFQQLAVSTQFTTLNRITMARGAYAYRFANMPVQLALSADDIVPAFTAETRMVCALQDNDVSFDCAIELDVRDAPLRELIVESSPGWIVAAVNGKDVLDYQLKNQSTTQDIHLLLKGARVGKSLINVRLERSLPEADKLELPRLHLKGTRSQRGFLVLTADQGMQLATDSQQGLREVHTQAVPLRVADTRLAFRVKDGDWKLVLNLNKRPATVHSELFHLVSIGDNAIYGSCAVTYHISEAPLRSLRLFIPESAQSIEFTGGDIRNWERNGNIWTLHYREKLLGDHTLLVTYDQPFNFQGGELAAGGIQTLDGNSEHGFIAIAGGAALNAKAAQALKSGTIEIDQDELPEAYHLLINDPVLRAYKHIGPTEPVQLSISRLPTEMQLEQLADHSSMTSTFSLEGEVVTQASYFIKNSSAQYLRLNLPEGATLWKSSIDGAEVSALKAEDGEGLLIPLKRHPDPNQPSRVEIQYAEQHDPLEKGGTYTLNALSSAAPGAYAEWKISVPEDFTLAQRGGNMEGQVAAVPRKGVANMLKLSLKMLHTLKPWLWLLCCTVLGIAIWQCLIHRVGRIITLPLAIIVGIVLTAISGGFSAFDQILCQFTNLHSVSPRELALSRVVHLAGTDLSTTLRIAPSWMGTSGAPLTAVACGLGGLVLLAVSLRFSKLKSLLSAVGFTLILIGLSQLQSTVIIAALLLPILFIFPIARLLLRGLQLMLRNRIGAPPFERSTTAAL